jgi:hypothetical protein
VSELADRADPAGVVPVDIVLPEQATSIAEAGGHAGDLDELTTAFALGFASRFGLDVTIGDGLPAPEADAAWLDAGRIAPHLDRHAVTRDMLGVLEVYAASENGRVTDVRVCAT